MKLLANKFFFLIMIVLFTSCEKVIDVSLNDTAKKYVIEGNITNEAGDCKIKITQSKDFSENNDFSGVSGAKVTVSDNGGAAIVLTETSQGMYESTTIKGITGHTYRLNVTINRTVFTSSSTMPVPVNLDSLYIKDEVFFGNSVKLASIAYSDPVTIGNAYHFILYKNKDKESTVFVTNDDFTNGNKVTNDLWFADDNDDDSKKLKQGDTVKVVMECVDMPIYNYWYSIDAASGSSNNATPANPVSNVTGGALGYFSAHTVQTKSTMVR